MTNRHSVSNPFRVLWSAIVISLKFLRRHCFCLRCRSFRTPTDCLPKIIKGEPITRNTHSTIWFRQSELSDRKMRMKTSNSRNITINTPKQMRLHFPVTKKNQSLMFPLSFDYFVIPWRPRLPLVLVLLVYNESELDIQYYLNH